MGRREERKSIKSNAGFFYKPSLLPSFPLFLPFFQTYLAQLSNGVHRNRVTIPILTIHLPPCSPRGEGRGRGRGRGGGRGAKAGDGGTQEASEETLGFHGWAHGGEGPEELREGVREGGREG